MTSQYSFRRICFLLLLPAVWCCKPLMAQDEKPLKLIAVLRMKNIAPTVENTRILQDFAGRTNAALVRTRQVAVLPEEVILEALDDEGVDLDGLIDLEEYLDVGKALKTDYIVIGSVTQKMMTLYAHSRVYSVKDGSLAAVVGSELGIDRLPELIDLLAYRIANVLEHPEPLDSLYSSFEWSQDFRFAFGPDRLDLAPPVVHYVNQNPPFEIAVRADMDRIQGGYVVTNFDIFADNEPIAAVGPHLEPPLLLRETEVMINGHLFCFRADLKQMRGPRDRAITSALITITARSCE